MAEALTRTAPLAAYGDALGALPEGMQIIPRPFVAMADLRVDPTGPAAAAVAEYLGVALPTTPSTYVESETATAIWLGPDEWLITSPFRTPGELETGLRDAVSAGGAEFAGTVVDVSAQRTTVALRGEHARDLLAGGCSLDLHPVGQGTERVPPAHEGCGPGQRCQVRLSRHDGLLRGRRGRAR